MIDPFGTRPAAARRRSARIDPEAMMITIRAAALAALVALPFLQPGAASAQEPERADPPTECRCPAPLFEWEGADPQEWDLETFRFEGAPDFDYEEMRRRAGELRARGDTLRLALPRTVMRLPFGGAISGSAPARYGLRLQDLNEELGRYFGRDEGALVLEVDEDAPLALEAGDVLLAIDGRDVANAAHAVRILRSYEPDEEIAIEVWREGASVTVQGRAP